MTKNQMKKCSPSQATMEMQMKTMLRLHLTPAEWLPSRTETTTNVSKDVGEKEPSYTTNGNVN
jgi:hypothetical protein